MEKKLYMMRKNLIMKNLFQNWNLTKTNKRKYFQIGQNGKKKYEGEIMKFRIVFRKGTRVNTPHTTNKLLRDITIPLWNIKLTNLVISWSKSSRNSFRKFKIQVLFIKSDIVPFKVLPIDLNALMPALDPALETFLELYCRYSHQSCLRFFHYLLSA